MAVCPKCGASVPDGSRFCIECGAKLEAAPVLITADTPVPEPELTLPEVPAMDIPVPEVPAVGPEISAAPAESEPAPVFESAPQPAPVFEPASQPVFEPAPAPVEPVPQPVPMFTVPAQDAARPAPAPVYPQPAPAAPVYQPPAADPEKPEKKSKYAPMTSWGMAIQLILMAIPFVGFVLMVVWACGGCRKIARRNLARANLILLILGVILVIIAALLARFAFSDVITSIFEQLLPGYTLQWG